ncbi:DUF1232 domain-containing protein [Pseudaminobacter sp. 19-2017]|uniref:DUF1232 domain-containing protein n=1 Tax=Pseudaminobacter soli (ex Zhang et al. 2022) TaxID=2831468 RepID=A0A942E3D6_9HYPH|nr:DUF1232 domain-containing protein [Pseudaminobacter soli]
MRLFETAKRWARAIKRDLMVLWLAARDPRVPWRAKAVAGAVAAYGLSPIDLIPDFIPVLGILDDLIIIPAGILLALWLIPAAVVEELRAQAARLETRPRSRVGMLFIIAVWIAFALLLAWLFSPVSPVQPLTGRTEGPPLPDRYA